MSETSLKWTEPAAFPSLEGNTVHVWLASVPELRSEINTLAGALSVDERERAERFRFSEPRQRYEITRGILRLLIAQYTGVPAPEIIFAYNQHGKPLLNRAPDEAPLFFNASHSGDFAAFAFTRVAQIGVDIEQVRPAAWRDDIARKYFAAEELAQLAALPEAELDAAFFHTWTRKEAFVKARGDGIFAGLNTFAVTVAPGAIPRLLKSEADAEAPDRWWLSALPSLPGYAGAVAVETPQCSLSCFKISEIGFIQ